MNFFALLFSLFGSIGVTIAGATRDFIKNDESSADRVSVAAKSKSDENQAVEVPIQMDVHNASKSDNDDGSVAEKTKSSHEINHQAEAKKTVTVVHMDHSSVDQVVSGQVSKSTGHSNHDANESQSSETELTHDPMQAEEATDHVGHDQAADNTHDHGAQSSDRSNVEETHDHGAQSSDQSNVEETHDHGAQSSDQSDADVAHDHDVQSSDHSTHEQSDSTTHSHVGTSSDQAAHDHSTGGTGKLIQEVEGTPIILVFGQSNAGLLNNTRQLQAEVTEMGGTAKEVAVFGGGQSVAHADGAWNLVLGDGEDAQGESYMRLLETMAQVFDETPDAYIASAVWALGETDSFGSRHALNYYDATSTLFNQIREDLGEFPISIVGLSDFQSLEETGRGIVQEAQQQLAQDLDDVYFVDTNKIAEDLSLEKSDVLEDPLHFSPEFFGHIAKAVIAEAAVQKSLGFVEDTETDAGEHDHSGHSAISMPVSTPEEIEAFVAAVKSSSEGHHHADNMSKMTEHSAAFDLVPRDEATHIAIRDGDWDDPDTWYKGAIPDDDARVLIPEGIHVDYGTVSEARLFTLRVDGELEFATGTDSKLIVDTIVTSPTSKLTIGTEANPVDADVNVDIIFANNGPIDVEWDPMLLSRGMISHGEVSIYGTEKDSHEKVIEDPMAGDKSVTFAEVPTGWAVGDTIVIAGTRYEGYYDWIDPAGDYEPSEDEVRVITSIEGDTVHFEKALVHDHDAPRDDLKTSVANYTRNVSFETEDALLAETFERGHVMFMHNDDVDVHYAEFHELGRTDKSFEGRDASDFEEIAFDSNVKGRYSLHIHRAGTETGDSPAVLEGNAVFGSPGWGYVHHDSHAILTNNASFDTFGAGYVAESGNETGAWNDNIAILAQGASWEDPKGVNAGGSFYENFDMARTGDGFWFQGRMVESTDNVAASVHNGFVYFHRGPLGDGQAMQFDSETSDIASVFHYDDQVFPDEHPILGFNGNEAFAAKTGMYVLKHWFTQGHGVSTVLEDFTAWSVKDGVDLAYTGHYVLKDFDIIARDESDLRGDFGFGIKLGANVIDLTVVDANIEGFMTGINLNKSLVGDLSPELHSYTIVNPTFTDVDELYRNYDPNLDTITSHDELPNLTPDLQLDGPLVYSHLNPLLIAGTKTDGLGETAFMDGAENLRLSPADVLRVLEKEGYNTTSNGDQYFNLDIYFSDRLSGDIYKEVHPVFIEEGSGLGETGDFWYRNVEHNGVKDIEDNDDLIADAAELWATLSEGQLVLSEAFAAEVIGDDDHSDVHVEF